MDDLKSRFVAASAKLAENYSLIKTPERFLRLVEVLEDEAEATSELRTFRDLINSVNMAEQS